MRARFQGAGMVPVRSSRWNRRLMRGSKRCSRNGLPEASCPRSAAACLKNSGGMPSKPAADPAVSFPSWAATSCAIRSWLGRGCCGGGGEGAGVGVGAGVERRRVEPGGCGSCMGALKRSQAVGWRRGTGGVAAGGGGGGGGGGGAGEGMGANCFWMYACQSSVVTGVLTLAVRVLSSL